MDHTRPLGRVIIDYARAAPGGIRFTADLVESD
jgi:hypothetical protein